MTNSELLQQLIDEKGLKKGSIAKKMGVSYATLKRKTLNLRPFKAYEIQILCDMLGIDDLEVKEAIFFAEDVGILSTE